MPRRRRNSPKKIPQHVHRRHGTVKGAMRQFSVWVPEDVFEFFDAMAINEYGQKRSRAAVLQALVRNAECSISTTKEIR